MQSIIFHIDVNSAYLSWTAIEQLKKGAAEDLRTIPAIVGGDQESRHGVVLAKSIAAKKYGIRTGEPVVNAFRKCPNLIMVPPEHGLYHMYSKKMMTYLRQFTSELEQVSIDECYLDFTGIAHRYASPVEGAVEIKNGIQEQFGFTVNVGISTNKLLAKMASDFEKPNRIHTLFPEEIQAKMWPLPVGELYMAGRSSVQVLNKLEIKTIGDLAGYDPNILEKHLKSRGRMLWEFANGIYHSRVQAEPSEAKGIGNSTTLPQDVTDRQDAVKVLKELCESVARRLRNAGQKAYMVSVEIRYHDFQNVSHQKQLTTATYTEAVIYQAVCELFDELWDHNPIRLLGVRTAKLVDEKEPEQLDLFQFQQEYQKNEKQKHLDQALDTLKKKYGDGIIKKGLDQQ